jgi:ubiquinone/menaquinone biosynthesis C-methylase UbiE
MENNVFEQMAKRYDTEDRMELAKVIVKKVKSELQNSKSKTLLDYGSGTGLVSLELCDLVDSILLVDSSKQMLEVAKAKISHRGITNSEVIYSDFTQGTLNLRQTLF